MQDLLPDDPRVDDRSTACRRNLPAFATCRRETGYAGYRIEK